MKQKLQPLPDFASVKQDTEHVGCIVALLTRSKNIEIQLK
jgi:hypothetical protein